MDMSHALTIRYCRKLWKEARAPLKTCLQGMTLNRFLMPHRQAKQAKIIANRRVTRFIPQNERKAGQPLTRTRRTSCTFASSKEHELGMCRRRASMVAGHSLQYREANPDPSNLPSVSTSRRERLRIASGSIEHVIVLILENRSFDHKLGVCQQTHANFEGIPPRGSTRFDRHTTTDEQRSTSTNETLRMLRSAKAGFGLGSRLLTCVWEVAPQSEGSRRPPGAMFWVNSRNLSETGIGKKAMPVHLRKPVRQLPIDSSVRPCDRLRTHTFDRVQSRKKDCPSPQLLD